MAPWDGTHLLHQANHDPAQTVWFLAWLPFALAHGLNPLHSGYLDVGRGANLATNTSVPLLGLLGWPVTALAGPVATFNLLMRLSLAGSALAMFALLRRWTTWWPAAFLGGALYGFNSFMLQEAANHLHLVFEVLPPLILLALDELLITQRWRSVPAGLALGSLCAAQFFVNDEVLVGCFLLGAVGLVAVALARRREVGDHLRRAAPGLAAGGALFAVVVAYPAWYLVAGPQHLLGPTQPRWVIAGYAQDLLGPVRSGITETTRAAAAVVAAQHPSVTTVRFVSNAGYLGIPLALALVALAVAWRRRPLVALSTFLAAVSYLLSLGGRLTVLGHRSGLPLPAAVFSHLPLLYEITPERFSFFTFGFAAIVLGVGVDLTYQRVAGLGRGARTPAAIGILVAVGLCFVPMLLAAPSLAEAKIPEASAARAVTAVTPPGGTVLYLPYVRNFAAQPMVWQAQSAMAYRMVGGYVIVPRNHYSSGNFVIPHHALAAVLRGIPSVDPGVTPPKPPTAADEVAACHALPHVLHTYRVDTVVAWPAPATPLGAARRVIGAALGPPPLRAGRLLIWDHADRRLGPPTGCLALGGAPSRP